MNTMDKSLEALGSPVKPLADLFARYPGGVENPELIQIRKKHNLPGMLDLSQASFPRRNFKFPT
jgi:hypothetical protein